jgi:hypothetical protein
LRKAENAMSLCRASAKSAVLALLISCCGTATCGLASPALDRTQQALADLQSWLGHNENADRWRQFLELPQLEEQIAAGSQADEAVLASVLHRFESGANGLDLRRFADVRDALEAWQTERRESLDLPALVKAAQNDFAPVTAEDVAQAKADVAARADVLDQYLATGGANGQAWKKYLGWEALQAQLADGAQPDQAQLTALIDRLTANEDGLELPQFQELARALERYQAVALLSGVEDQSGEYSTILDRLAEDLAKYNEQPSARLSHSIGNRLGLISSFNQSPELVAAARRQYARPNAYIEVTSDFLSRAAARDVNEVGPVNDCILGTSISGTGVTTGNVVVRTLPAEDRARILLSVVGNTQARTTGLNGPAIMRSTSNTDFTSQKIVEITDPSFWVYPADVDARTNSHTYSVQKRGGGIGSRLVSRIGSRRVAESKAQADAIASDHAEDRIASEMNDEVIQQIRDARDRYSEEFRRPLMRRNAFPEMIRYSSTDSAVAVEVLHATRHQLGAATSPPASPTGHDIAARLNQTAVENGLAVLLGGATLSQETAEEDPKLNRKIPDWLQDIIDERQTGDDDQPDEDFKPWSIEFRRHRPISVEFRDNTITMTIHAARIVTGDETYEGWDLIALFTPHEQNGQFMLIREGEIDVLPSDFDPSAGTQLRRRDVALRNNLSKEINQRADRGEGIPEEIVLEPIEMPDDLQHLGMLFVRRLEPAAGWLTVGLNAE